MAPDTRKLTEISESQARLETLQELLRQQMEKHTEELARHNDLLLRLTLTVEKHEERSTKLEIRQDFLDKAVQDIRDHVIRVQGVGYLFKAMSLLAGALLGIGSLLWSAYQLAQKLGL